MTIKEFEKCWLDFVAMLPDHVDDQNLARAKLIFFAGGFGMFTLLAKHIHNNDEAAAMALHDEVRAELELDERGRHDTH